jgi:hypothetical protein
MFSQNTFADVILDRTKKEDTFGYRAFAGSLLAH